jgi:hypothetical protein
VLVCLLVDSLVSCISNLHIVLNSDLGGGGWCIFGPSRSREGQVVVVCILVHSLVSLNLTYTRSFEV